MFEIIIKNLKLFGFHGVKSEEKINGQEFLFNVRIRLNKNSLKVGNTYEDDISATVNYSEVIALINEINSLKKYDLLETLCEELSEKILERFPMISQIEVKVEKTSPPIDEDIGTVGVKFKAGRDRIIFKKPESKPGIEQLSKSRPGKPYICQNNPAGLNEAINTEDPGTKDLAAKSLTGKDNILFYLSVGSNIGDRETNLRTAVKELSRKKFISVIEVSSIYETEPMYIKAQDNFYNIILKGAILPDYNYYNAFEFLGLLKSVEYNMGRKAHAERYGPRIIDLDLLYFDDNEIVSDLLTLPHPKIIERNFVLIPLSEIEPDFIIDGKKITDLLNAVSPEGKVLKVKEW